MLTSVKALCCFVFLGSVTLNSAWAGSADSASFRWGRLEISNASRVTIIQGDEFRLWVDGSDWSSNTTGTTNGEEVPWEIDGEWLRINKFSAKELKVQQLSLIHI